MHYGEVEKMAESGQLWELISPQFLQKIHIILLDAVSPRISEKNCFKKTEEEAGEKGKKHVAHVY